MSPRRIMRPLAAKLAMGHSVANEMREITAHRCICPSRLRVGWSDTYRRTWKGPFQFVGEQAAETQAPLADALSASPRSHELPSASTRKLADRFEPARHRA